MKLALIPPNALAWQDVDPYRLILPQNCGESTHSKAVNKARRHGAYIILDNGAAEGLYFSMGALTDIAHRHMVNEIVLPDKQNDLIGTCDAVDDTLGAMGAFDRNMFSLMGVVQGATYEECAKCIDFYLERSDDVSTIGIPRHLLTTLGPFVEPEIRLKLAQYIRSRSQRVQIHLLGTSPDYIYELCFHGHAFRQLQVRGVDTSAPYTYAYANEWIGDGKVVLRQSGYFGQSFSTMQRTGLVQMNIDTLARWVHG